MNDIEGLGNALGLIEMCHLLYDIVKARGEELVFKDGDVIRVFIEDNYNEAVLELKSGRKIYALDAGHYFANEALESFQREYPDEYDAFMNSRSKQESIEYLVNNDTGLGNDGGGYAN